MLNKFKDHSRSDELIETIKATSGKRAAASLFSGCDGKLPSTQDIPASSPDLELISWLVITDNPQPYNQPTF